MTSIADAPQDNLGANAQSGRRRLLGSEMIAGGLILLLAVGVGAYIRLQPFLRSKFPLNDGGLFYVMAQDLVQTGFKLPAYSSYNAINMPFAYPPLAFYVAALLNKIIGSPMIEIVRLFPVVMNILTIPAFYLLGRVVLRSTVQSAFAVLVFAMLPRSYKWLIMGGGLTRSLGFFFAMLALHQAYLLYSTRQRRYLLPTILLCGLTLLSHPEMAIYTGCSVILFFLFNWRTREGLITTALVGVGTAIVAAPWWLTVISYHGVSPLLSAFQTGEYRTYGGVFILLLTGLAVSEQAFLGFIGLLGLVKRVAEGKLFLPVWLIALYAVDPRGALTYVSIPLALLAAIFIDEVLLAMIQKAGTPGIRRGLSLQQRIAVALVFSFVASYGFVYGQTVDEPVLAQSEREGMAWAAINTPKGSDFAVVTGQSGWASDSISEWFPVLSSRTSLATVQGFEWFPNRQFFERQKQFETLQACAGQRVECLNQWPKLSGAPFAFVYLAGTVGADAPLARSLSAATDYQLVYDQGGIKIYKYTGKF